MKPLTQEWFDKAEGDWVTAGRELRARKDPNYDAACFMPSNVPKSISKNDCKKKKSVFLKLVI